MPPWAFIRETLGTVYKTRAPRARAPMRPGKAVAMAAAPVLGTLILAADDAAEDAAEAPDDAALRAELVTEASEDEPDALADEALADAELTAEDSLPLALETAPEAVLLRAEVEPEGEAVAEPPRRMSEVDEAMVLVLSIKK